KAFRSLFRRRRSGTWFHQRSAAAAPRNLTRTSKASRMTAARNSGAATTQNYTPLFNGRSGFFQPPRIQEREAPPSTQRARGRQCPKKRNFPALAPFGGQETNWLFFRDLSQLSVAGLSGAPGGA